MSIAFISSPPFDGVLLLIDYLIDGLDMDRLFVLLRSRDLENNRLRSLKRRALS